MKIDCKFTLNYLNEQKRMCDTFKVCYDCPLYTSDGCGSDCNMDAEEMIDIVQKWSGEHPLKTRMDDFMEKHPKAMITSNSSGVNMPYVCAEEVGYCKCIYKGEIEMDCGKCWHEPILDVKANED